MTDVSKAAFARHLGISPGRVSQYIKMGMPTRWDGCVNIADGERWVRTRVGVSARTTRTQTPAPVRTVNKSTVCRHFGWTRATFDKNAANGMPVVAAPANRNGEYVVDPDAVSRWLEKLEEARLERARRYKLAEEERQREVQRILDRMTPEQRRKLLPRWAR